MSGLSMEVLAPVIEMFRGLVKDGAAARARYDRVVKNQGTSFMDAVKDASNKDKPETYDTQIASWQSGIEEANKKAADLRESQKSRLVELARISGEAASLDRLKREASQARGRVRGQLDAFVKGEILTDEELIAQLTKEAEAVLGKPRGRAASAASSSSDEDSDNSDDSDDESGSDDETPSSVTEL